MGDSIINITDKNFQSEVGKSTLPVFIDFWAPWCSPCRAISPLVDEIATIYAGKIKVVKINVDEARLIAQRFSIRSIPAFILLDGGEVKSKLVTNSRSKLITQIDEYLQHRVVKTDNDQISNEICSTRRMEAFINNHEIKSMLVQQAMLHASTGSYVGIPIFYDKSSGRGSPFSLLLQSETQELLSQQLGIPQSVATLYEGIFMSFIDTEHTDGRVVSIASELFPQWLQKVEPGQDLSLLPELFVTRLLRALVNNSLENIPFKNIPRNISDILLAIAELCQRHTAGEFIEDQELSELRSSAENIINSTQDPLLRILLTFAEALTKSIFVSQLEIADSVSSFLNSLRSELVQTFYTTEQLHLSHLAMNAVNLARHNNPAIDYMGINSLPEVLAWEASMPKSKQRDNLKKAFNQMASFSLQLHQELSAAL